MKKLATFLTALLFVLFLTAQDFTYDPAGNIPLNPDVLHGKLDNGMTYYIQANAKPEARAEFYLIVNAGAILEDETQNGLAHFCEHMCFNGTENFEKHEILNFLQSIGMKFGPEINAFTSHDNTTYMLQKVPLEDPANVDTALMVLYDWATNVSFEDEEIDYERGVLHEEWRTGRSAMFRLMKEAQKSIFMNSKYATHDVIGDIEIIDHAPYEELKRYYSDWYRPDLQAVIAVGDFDAEAMEKQIREVFSAIPARENPRYREEFPIPDHEQTYVSINTDPEAQFNLIQLIWKHDPPSEKNQKYFRDGLIQNLYAIMLNARLSELTLKEDPPFIFGISMYQNMARTKDAYLAFGVASNEKIKDAIEALLVENERVKRHGFTATELERAKAEYLSQVETQFRERDKQESSNIVWEYSSNFLEGEPAPGIKYTYAFSENVLPGITLDELNGLAERWITDENRVVVVGAPETSAPFLPDTEEVLALVAAVEAMELDPYVDRVSDAPLVADIPAPGSIKKKARNKKLGTETWELSNGVRVVFKTTDFSEDAIEMSAFSFGGTSLYDIDELVSADFCVSVITRSGLAGFDETELQKKLAGKVVSVWPYINGVSEGFSGECTPADLETMMQLVYLYFTQPRKDEAAFNSMMEFMKGILANKENDPSSALQDTLMVTMANYNPRVRPMTADILDEAKLNKVHYIFQERFGDPGSFTFYFVGNIDPAGAEDIILTYLGGLPVVKRNESWKDNGIRPPVKVVEKTVVRNMEVPKGTVTINFANAYDFDDEVARLELTVLCDILDIRFTESIREEQGGTYGVAVREQQNHYPWENYSIGIRFDCDPENVDKLKAIVYEEIDKLMADGPTEKDLKKVKENLIKSRAENLERNSFWLGMLSNIDYHDADPKGIFNYESMVNSMTTGSLKDAASKFFDINHVEVIMIPADVSKNIKNPVMEQ